jgi:hypothetical protein
MPLITPTPEQALAGLRAIKTVTTATRPLDPTRRAFCEASQKHLLGTEYDLDHLEPIDPGELARQVEGPAEREQLVRAMCIYVMVPDEVDRAEMQTAERFAEALGVRPVSLHQMRELYDHRMLALRFDAVRSSFLGDSLRRRAKDDGALAVLRSIGALLGVYESEEVAARYRALEGYPAGSLGRAFFQFYMDNGFSFPGEKGGPPEGVVTHDLSHVISGYGTDMKGETFTISFQAGYRREGPFDGLLFALLNVQKGVRLTKLAPAVTHLLDEPGMPEQLVKAWVRGAAASIDLTKDWNYWDDMRRPLDEVRARYHVPPIEA